MRNPISVPSFMASLAASMQVKRRPSGDRMAPAGDPIDLVSEPQAVSVRSVSVPQRSRSTVVGLGLLAGATFIGVTTEVLPIGLLPAISADLSTSESVLGLAVSGYAFVVALTATPLTAATARWPRKQLLLVVLAVFALSNAVAATSSTYPVFLAARVLGGLCHGVFWSMVAGYAARLVSPHHIARATSAVFTGSALALAVGVPVGTAVGDAAGWRTAFAGAAVVTALIAVLACLALPPLDATARPGAAPGTSSAAPGSVRAALAQPGVRAIVIITGLLILGHFTVFSYTSVYLRDVGVPAAAVSAVLFGYGAAGVLGTIVLGRAYDRRPGLSFAVTISAMLSAYAVLAVLAVLAPSPGVGIAAAAAIIPLGGASIALSVALQAMMLAHAGPAPDAASSLLVAAFNAGIGGGALLGSVLLATTGTPLLPIAALLIAGMGALIAARTRPTQEPPRIRHG